MAGTKWSDLTPEEREERKARMAAGRKAKAERVAEAKAAGALKPEPAGMPAERRARLLEGVDPEIAALISDEELEKIEAEERRKAEAEKKSRALAVIRAELAQRARVDNELISPDVIRSEAERKWLAEEVTFKVNLPSGGGAAGFRVNGFLYENGRVYTRPRHVFLSLFHNHYGAWVSELAFRTLDQHKEGQAARFIAGQHVPQFEVRA